ncbi:MAG: S41 family peptidase [Rhodospirillales bacterium]|nr:S41 family peptidase [Rhodospirillales bacterium]
MGEDSAFQRTVSAIRSYATSLPSEANKELSRFNEIHREYAVDSENTRELKHFKDAFVRIRSDYLHPIADAKLIAAALEGVNGLEDEPGTVSSSQVVEAGLDAMVASLDPHSAYLNAEEMKETFISTRGQFGGLGIEVTMQDGMVKVVSPIEGTPAFRAGLKPGDLISHLDGDPIQGATIMEAVKRMRGKPGTDILLTVRREGVPSFDVTITRAIITVRAVRWHTEGDIGYIRVASFTEQAEDGIATAFRGIRGELGATAKGYVLDLRNNPGGLLDQSLAVADAFLERGRIVSVRGRDPKREQVFVAEAGDLADGLPIVVLINGGSASASEIVAVALQEGHRATVMGRRSFGKGSVQTITPLPVQGAVKLTTALYYSPNGRTIQGQGVLPDIEIAATDTAARQRESDLPGALAAANPSSRKSLGLVAEESCPQAGDEGKDRILGCALAYLRAGSAKQFLAAVGQSPKM